VRRRTFAGTLRTQAAMNPMGIGNVPLIGNTIQLVSITFIASEEEYLLKH
jgi:hypothetical protein